MFLGKWCTDRARSHAGSPQSGAKCPSGSTAGWPRSTAAGRSRPAARAPSFAAHYGGSPLDILRSGLDVDLMIADDPSDARSELLLTPVRSIVPVGTISSHAL